jgi:hypothetical protein
MHQAENFIKSFVTAIPRMQALSSRILTKHSLIVNYPITLKPTTSNRLAIYSEGPVSKSNDVLLLAMSECIFSSGFSGANQKE